MPDREKSGKNKLVPASEASLVRSALDQVLDSEEFSASPRLRRFLRYVVEEKLAGRDTRIKGKTIAVDVYDRDLDGSVSTDNVVRVEARRLRRLLTEYYEGSGRCSPLRIHIDAGGYVPRFEKTASSAGDQEDMTNSPPETPSQPPERLRFSRPAVIVGAIVVLVIIGSSLAVYSLSRPGTMEALRSGATDGAIRLALRAKSPDSVQSSRLAEQARDMLFPLFDPKHQELAIELFDHAIELDDEIPDGYAGKAQALGTLALLTPDDDPRRPELLKRAQDAANTALEFGQTNAWAHSARSWVSAVSGDLENALKHADVALDLAPNNGYILDFDGAIAILAGDASRAVKASDPERARLGTGQFAAPNVRGVANYMLGNHQKVVDAFSRAPSEGAPVLAPALMLLAASYDHLGNTMASRDTILEMQATWPGFPAEFVVGRMFNDPAISQDILMRLRKNGLKTAGPAEDG